MEPSKETAVKSSRHLSTKLRIWRNWGMLGPDTQPKIVEAATVIKYMPVRGNKALAGSK